MNLEPCYCCVDYYVHFISLIAFTNSRQLPQWPHRPAVIHHGTDAVPRGNSTHLHNNTGDWWQGHAGHIPCFYGTECNLSLSSSLLLECQTWFGEERSLVLASFLLLLVFLFFDDFWCTCVSIGLHSYTKRKLQASLEELEKCLFAWFMRRGFGGGGNYY